jgi:hypothetical protein
MKLGIVAGTAVIAILAGQVAVADTSHESRRAASPDKVVYDAASAFEFLKTLGGTWQRGTSADELASVYVGGLGSFVVERTFVGQPNEMMSVYHMNGKDLLQTHYCMLQNSTVMKFQPSGKPGEIKFAYQSGINMKSSADAHTHEGTIEVVGKDAIVTSYFVFQNDAPIGGGPVPMTRIRADSAK